MARAVNCSGYGFFVKTAIAVSGFFTLTEHRGFVPRHEPLQRLNRHAGLGVAINLTIVPLVKLPIVVEPDHKTTAPGPARGRSQRDNEHQCRYDDGTCSEQPEPPLRPTRNATRS